MSKDARFVEGHPEAFEKVRKFVVDMCGSTEIEGDFDFEMHQKVTTGGESAICNFPFEHDDPDAIENVAKEVIDKASDYAIQFWGKIRFILRVQGKKTPFVNFSLVVPKIDEDEEYDDPEELPNKAGLVHQAQRHLEKMANIAIDATRERAEDLKEQLRAKDLKIAKLETDAYNNLKLAQELMNSQHLRDKDMEEMRLQQARKDKAVDAFTKAMPLLAAKFLGGGQQMAQDLGSQNESPIEGMLERLFESLEKTPEKLHVIAGSLDQLDVQIFAEIHQYIAAKREAKQRAQAAQQANTPVSPVATPPQPGYSQSSNGAGPVPPPTPFQSTFLNPNQH